jgi:hypothetical protein
MKVVDTSTDHLFEHAIISFAIDVSTSTRGQIIQAEQRLVLDISTILSEKARATAKVLPWCGRAGTVVGLDQLGTLQTELGTVPSAILDSSAPRTALENSTLWFLITDGQIQKQERERFARLIARYQLHGTACVTVIAGHTSWATPSQYDISVGVSVFAVVPDSLFLFCDVKTGELMVLQSKGVFKSLLRGASNPLIDDATSWSSFPHMHVDHFRGVTIPAPKRLSVDEIALQDGFVIKFEDLWSNHLSQELVTKILSDDDNIASLVMTAQTRDDTARFQNWLQKQHIKVDDPLLKPRHDVLGSAAERFRVLMDMLKAGRAPHHLAQSDLRKSYAINMRSFIRQFEEKRQMSMIRSSVIQSTSTRSSSRIESALSLSSQPISYSGSPPSLPGQGPAPVTLYSQPSSGPFNWLSSPQAQQSLSYNPHEPPPYVSYSPMPPLYGQDSRPVNPPLPTQIDLSGLLYTPGFRKNDGSFTGNCCICGSDNVTLAWLFRHHPDSPNTPGFPAPGSSSPLAFPLAMGNFPETDIISAVTCCDPCSVFCVKLQTSPFSEDVFAALPMVRHAANEKPYLDVLDKVLGKRFAQKHLPQIFMAVLINTAPTVEESAFCSPAQFNEALEWTCRDLLHSSTEVLEPSANFSRKPTQSSLMPLVSILRESFWQMNDEDSSVTHYPIEGFPVLLRVASIAMIGLEDRRRAIFRRLLYALTESYMMIRTDSSDPKADPRSGWQRILWIKEPQDEPSSITLTSLAEKSSKTTRTGLIPVGSIPIPKLVETPLLQLSTYNTLLKVPEFQDLIDPANQLTSWVPPAIAAFLHSLNALGWSLKLERAPADSSGDAYELFNRLVANVHLRPITLRPETLTKKEAMSIIKSVCAAF